MKENKRARDLIEQPGFFLGPFPKGKRCEEKDCRESAFSATDDNRVRCYEHTLSYIRDCAAKSTTTPKELFDALTEQIKQVRALRALRSTSSHREIEDPRAPGQTVIPHAFVPLAGVPYCAQCGWPRENHL